jgi:hypothetical protein
VNVDWGGSPPEPDVQPSPELQPDRPVHPVLITGGTIQCVKRWVYEAGLTTTEWRWLSDSTAVRRLGEERWYVDIGACGLAVGTPARTRYEAAKAELVRLQAEGGLKLKTWRVKSR